MSDLTRRDFLAATAATGLAAGLYASGVAAAESEKPKLRMAVMGLNGRGKGLLSGFAAFPEVEVTYLCDPDADVLPGAVKVLEGRDRPVPKVIPDFRTALEDPEVDILVCAAPDHWHALATILACQAGKDVYVEKPVCHNIAEGKAMVAAARKHGRVVQAGTQRRSGADFQAAVEEIKSGSLGKIHFTRTWITSERPAIGHVAVSEPPANLDFNLWCGPAADDGYRKNLIHYHWHWRWNYGTGECGNNGIHALDIARWGLGFEHPEIITCGGGKYSFDDDQETPDTQLATFEFPGGALQWEHRTWSKRGIDGQSFGIVFYGTEGTLVIQDKGWSIFDGKDKVVKSHEGADRENAHLKNFLECVATREKPNADIEIGHRSTQLCHLANIAWRTRSTVKFDPATEQIVDNPAAVALMSREYRKGFELPQMS